MDIIQQPVKGERDNQVQQGILPVMVKLAGLLGGNGVAGIVRQPDPLGEARCSRGMADQGAFGGLV